MRRLAVAFAELEGTRSRSAMVRVLAELFRSAAPSELGMALYLLQGRLRPAFEATEIGLGEQTMRRVLAEAYRIPPERVARASEETGDIGLAAERLHPQTEIEIAVAEV